MKIIANPVAGHGQGKRWIKRLHRLLRDKPLKYELLETQGPGHAAQLARELADGGERRIIAMGGDGTISEVASALVETDLELGLIPVGTGNDLARSLQIPFNDLDAALEVLREGRIRRIDVGRERDRTFLLMTAFGYPSLVAEETNKMRRLKGSAAFFIAVCKALHRMQVVRIRMVLDGRSQQLECTSVLVQNTPYCGGGQLLAPGASMEDGLLDVVVIGPVGKLSLMAHFPKVYRGTHVGHPSFSIFQARRVEIQTEFPMPKMFDGDLHGTTPIEAISVPGALSVVVPLE
ncbi:MAG: diacylglycerol kinase family protein [Acidobacteriota bacterium]